MPNAALIVLSLITGLAALFQIIVAMTPIIEAPKEYKMYVVIVWVIVIGLSAGLCHTCLKIEELKKIMNKHGLYEVSVPVEKVTVSEIQWQFKNSVSEAVK